MKTTFSIEDVSGYLAHTQHAFAPESVTQLNEGHTSQVFSVMSTSGDAFVIRIRSSRKDFEADQFAFDTFSKKLPIPEVIEIGQLSDSAYYAITPMISGDTLKSISANSFTDILIEVHDSLSKIFSMNISRMYGYGVPDFRTGNAKFSSYKEALRSELAMLDVEKLRKYAHFIGLPTESVDLLVKQFNDNLPYVSEKRRLLHGDPGGDNFIVSDGVVVALLDWEQMEYGDWLRDFSRFEFWNMHEYGDAGVFADQYNLESEYIRERKAVFWAINAFRNIEFAAVQKNEKVAAWMRFNLKRLIV